MSRRKALVFECLEYRRAHTRECLVILGEIAPEPVPLRVQGHEWPVGTRFGYMGSRNTSAGFDSLDFRGFEPMEYVGQFENLDGRLALFKAGDKPPGGYFAWHPYEFGLVWGTDARSGRVIQMNHVIVAERKEA